MGTAKRQYEDFLEAKMMADELGFELEYEDFTYEEIRHMYYEKFFDQKSEPLSYEENKSVLGEIEIPC